MSSPLTCATNKLHRAIVHKMHLFAIFIFYLLVGVQAQGLEVGAQKISSEAAAVPSSTKPALKDPFYESNDFDKDYDVNDDVLDLGEGSNHSHTDEDEEDDQFDEDLFYMNDTEYDHHLRRQLSGCSDCVVNYNRRVVTGTRKVIVVPVEFSNCKFGSGRKAVPRSGLLRSMRYLAGYYKEKSRGLVTLSTGTFSSKKRLSQRAKCSARFRVKRSFSFSSYAIKIATYACKICGFSNAGGGWVHFGKKSFSYGTLVHEVGHLFGLAHASSFQYKNNKIVGLNEYGDYTSQMGRYSCKSYNAPMHHWLGWLRPYEVKTIELGRTYKLRALDKVSIDQKDVQAALVYNLPHSGNRMYISLRRRESGIGRRQYFESRTEGFAVHIAKPCHNCRFFKTLLARFVGTDFATDQTGLVIETSFLNDEKDLATIRVTYNKTFDLCTKPPTIKLEGKFDRHGRTIVVVTMTNNNAKFCRPMYVGGDIMIGIRGSSAEFMRKTKGMGRNYGNSALIMSGQTQIRHYKINRNNRVGEFVFDWGGSRKAYCIRRGVAKISSSC